jgi:hypothetical protein
MIYRKEKGTRGSFTSKNRGFLQSQKEMEKSKF